MQHVRGCLKYRDRGGSPFSLSLSLSPLRLDRSLLYEAPLATKELQQKRSGRKGPQRHTRKGGHLCPSSTPPLPCPGPHDREYGPRLMGSSRIVVPIPRFPPFTVPLSFFFFLFFFFLLLFSRVHVRGACTCAPKRRRTVGVLSLSFSSGYFDRQLRANVGGRAGFRRDAIRFGVSTRRGADSSSAGWTSSVLEIWNEFKRPSSIESFACRSDLPFYARRINRAMFVALSRIHRIERSLRRSRFVCEIPIL